jgi:hypothetical protein
VVVNRELRELERLVKEGTLSPEVAAPAIAAAKSKGEQTNVTHVDFSAPRPSAAEWRAAVVNMREVLTSDDIPAARDVLRDLIGPISCVPARNYVLASLAAREVRLAVGIGRFCGSGGRI